MSFISLFTWQNVEFFGEREGEGVWEKRNSNPTTLTPQQGLLSREQYLTLHVTAFQFQLPAQLVIVMQGRGLACWLAMIATSLSANLRIPPQIGSDMVDQLTLTMVWHGKAWHRAFPFSHTESGAVRGDRGSGVDGWAWPGDHRCPIFLSFSFPLLSS